MLVEPFLSTSSIFGDKLLNIFGLVVVYNEKDSTLSVANLSQALEAYSELIQCNFEVKLSKQNNLSVVYHAVSEYGKREMFPSLREINTAKKCKHTYKNLKMSLKRIKNGKPYWVGLWNRVVGVVGYVDPIQAVIRTWNVKFAVLPCELKWSNNLIMILPRFKINQTRIDGKCLRFTAATEGELFVVVASTPSDQNSWYVFQITTKGVVFYRVSLIK